MRKITEETHEAFMHRRNYGKDNTTVENENGETYLYIYGHLIVKTDKGRIVITTAGYNTNTTIERLSPFATIRRAKGQMFINDFEWDGSWIIVGEI